MFSRSGKDKMESKSRQSEKTNSNNDSNRNRNGDTCLDPRVELAGPQRSSQSCNHCRGAANYDNPAI